MTTSFKDVLPCTSLNYEFFSEKLVAIRNH